MSNKSNGTKNEYKFFTVEFFGVTLIITTLLLFVCLIFGRDVLFDLGEIVQRFLLGTFGYLSYPILLCLGYVGVMLLIGKRIVKDNFKPAIKKALALFVVFMCLLNVITGDKTATEYGEYLSSAYASANGGLDSVYAGGVIFSLITYPFVRYLKYVGAIITISVILAFLVYLIFFKKRKAMATENIAQSQGYTAPQGGFSQQPSYGQPVNNYSNSTEFQGYPSGNYAPNTGAFERPVGSPTPEAQQPINADSEQSIRERSKEILFGNRDEDVINYSDVYKKNFEDGRLNTNNVTGAGSSPQPDFSKSSVDKNFDKGTYDDEPINKTDVISMMQEEEKPVNNIAKDYFRDINKNSAKNTTKETEADENSEVKSKYSTTSKGDQIVLDDDKTGKIYVQNNIIENMPDTYNYIKPPISLFSDFDNEMALRSVEDFKTRISSIIVETYKEFGLDIRVARVLHGPTVTRFDIEIPRSVQMSKVTRFYEDINLRVAASGHVRFITPVPNTSYIGCEVPNENRETVGLKDILLSSSFANSSPSSLTCALGKDTVGSPVVLNIIDAPHVLLTGATGSGKSVTLNAIILSLISKYSPKDMRMIIVDAKIVGFKKYLGVPHLLFNHIIEDLPECNSMLTWAVEEMNNRYKTLDSLGVDNLEKYNKIAESHGKRKLFRLVIIIDEFADLMLQDSKGIATNICLLAQKARACGIHLILSAQRPDAKIVEGGIKSNVPTRIVLMAANLVDSQIALGEGGAENLRDKGDCLFKLKGSTANRIQCAYTPDEEIDRVIKFIVDNNETYYDMNTYSQIKSNCSGATTSTSSQDSTTTVGGAFDYVSPPSTEKDPLAIHALKIAVEMGSVSISFLQRRLSIGFTRAGKFVDWMVENHYVSEVMKSGKRETLMTKEEFKEKFGDSGNL